MTLLKNIDLRTDEHSYSYIKSEVVKVIFAKQSGKLISAEGVNAYNKGDALITGSTGNLWCVSQDRFDIKYEPIAPLKHGEEGLYKNKPLPVLAKQMHVPFSIARSKDGDVLCGQANDWLMQYDLGDYGIVHNERFQQVYRKI